MIQQFNKIKVCSTVQNYSVIHHLPQCHKQKASPLFALKVQTPLCAVKHVPFLQYSKAADLQNRT